MAKAGYCSECRSSVWLRTDGSCMNGHGPGSVSGIYETEAVEAGSQPAQSSRPAGPFAGMPYWVKFLLAVVLLPLTILYGIYVMWRDRSFGPVARVLLTAAGGVLALALVSPLAGGRPTGPARPAAPPPAATAPAAVLPPPVASAPSAQDTEAVSATDAPAATAAVAPPPVAKPPVPVAAVAPQPPAEVEVTVYGTRTGSKYHRDGCQYLRKSKIPMTLQDAKAAGLGP